MNIGSNEGFPPVNNNMRGTEDLPVLFKIVKVFINRKMEIRCTKHDIQAVRQVESFSGCLWLRSGYRPHSVFESHLCVFVSANICGSATE